MVPSRISTKKCLPGCASKDGETSRRTPGAGAGAGTVKSLGAAANVILRTEYSIHDQYLYFFLQKKSSEKTSMYNDAYSLVLRLIFPAKMGLKEMCSNNFGYNSF